MARKRAGWSEGRIRSNRGAIYSNLAKSLQIGGRLPGTPLELCALTEPLVRSDHDLKRCPLPGPDSPGGLVTITGLFSVSEDALMVAGR